MNKMYLSISLMIVAVASLTAGLNLGEKCQKHDDCSSVSGAHCAMRSDCEDGYCSCIANQKYTDDGKTCKDVTKVLAKGDACSTKTPDGMKEPCDRYLGCSKCPDKDTYKCRSKASNISLATSLLVLVPVMSKLFF